MNVLRRLGRKLGRVVGREDGSSIIELAVIFPILLLLFVATAELGRLFYTYTTLAKATKAGARYLSYQRDVRSADPAKVAAVKLRAQNLVVCGDVTGCAGRTPIIYGLDTDNPANSVAVTLPAAGAAVKYVKVELQNATFKQGVFNLASVTGASNSTFYFALSPGTEMRYMP